MARRTRRGSELPQTVLTEEQVREIRHLHATSLMGYKPLATRYGVSRTCIMQVVRRETWAWVK